MSALLLLGKYQLTERLGPQGLFETYGALMDVGGVQQPCVVKWLRADGMTAEKYRAAATRFLAAGRRLLDRHDPSWPVVFDVTENDKGAFLIREFVAGVDLYGLLQTAREKTGGATTSLDPAVAGLVASKLAQVLGKAHSAQPPLCHLGLDPSNVLVTPKGDVIITDFGLSASLRGKIDQSMGKWAFVAPELIGADVEDLPSPAGVAADLYSLGGLLFYLLAGHPPVEARSLAELNERAWEPLPPLPHAPERLATAIASLTAAEPRSRCQSADEALGLISGVTPAQGKEATQTTATSQPERTAVPPTQPAPPPPANKRDPRPRKPSRPRSLRSAALLFGCLLLTAGAAVLLLHSVHVRHSEAPQVRVRRLQPSVEIPMQQFDASAPLPPQDRTIVPAPKRTLPRLPGRLSMTTEPDGADLWLDGVWQGKTPLDIPAGAGGHRVVVIAPGHRIFKEVYDTTDGEIVVRELDPVDPPARGDAFLNVECKTAGKFPVLLDAQETGHLCPVKMLPVVSGRHQVSVYVPALRGTDTQETIATSGPKPTTVKFKDYGF